MTKIELLRSRAHNVDSATGGSFDPLLENIGDASFVLLGEASHGTHEFYQTRAEITKRLIQEKGFTTVAIEGDWPDAYRVNRYLYSQSSDTTAQQSLEDFKRFPAWMWRNSVIVDFITWLHAHNTSIDDDQRIGFYGLDLYSLHRSMELIIEHLEKIDPAAAMQARQRYDCFDKFGKDPQAYGYWASSNPLYSCQKEVDEQLNVMQQQLFDTARRHGYVSHDELFFLEQNALVVKNAEHYYRSIFDSPDAHSWNIRDTHMTETVKALIDHRKKQNKETKVIIWAHNSHVGDARATEMGWQGQLNIGQLIREQYPEQSYILGFTTYHGTVSAASGWGRTVERKKVRPGIAGGYEDLFHRLELPSFLILFKGDEEITHHLSSQKLQRAIGVIYHPHTERQSHYFYAQLANQFDAVIHFDKTQAVTPLDHRALWEKEDLPETFPFGE